MPVYACCHGVGLVVIVAELGRVEQPLAERERGGGGIDKVGGAGAGEFGKGAGSLLVNESADGKEAIGGVDVAVALDGAAEMAAPPAKTPLRRARQSSKRRLTRRKGASRPARS
jgi:hypothetical protein